jgi:hypothetical protein
MILNFVNPFYSTPKKVLKEILEKFKLDKEKKFVDLGSGDGRMVFAVHKKFKCTSIGYEISPLLLIIQNLAKIFIAPFNSKVQFREESFFNVSLTEFDVIYCSLPDALLSNLEEKFKEELKEGSKVFTYKTKLPNKKAKEIKLAEGILYEYTY